MSQWGQHGPRPRPADATRPHFEQLELVESAEIACSVDDAWTLIADVTRIGDFSPECIGVRWLDGADGGCVGARFEGTNRIVSGADEYEWIRVCTVTHWVPGRLFGYVVGDRYDGSPASRWQFEVTTAGEGRCQVRQSFRHDPDGLSGLRSSVDADPAAATTIIEQRVADLAQGMRRTLRRMKEVLEDRGEGVGAVPEVGPGGA